MKGALSEGAVPHLLRAIYVGRRTGSLHLAHGDERHSLRFRRGHLVNARTNVVGERLGEMMVRRGLLSMSDLARATTIVIATRKRLGMVLLEMGVVDSERLDDAVEIHVHELLTKLFTWTEGSYGFEDEPEADAELPLKLSTGELILEAVRAIRDPRVVHEALGDTDRVLVPSADPLLRFQKLTLSPTDGFVLSRIDGSTSLREVVQMIPVPAEDVERSLLSLLSTGVIEFTSSLRRAGAAPAATRPAPAASPRLTGTPPAPASPPPVATPPSATPAPASAPAPAASATPPAGIPASGPQAATRSADDSAARRREILEAAQDLRARDHFQVLGIPRSAKDSEVKEAYFRLARRFHPDAHHSSELADLRDALEAVFIRLGEAYEVLRDPRKRADYEERLGRPRPTAPAAAPAAAGATANAPTPAAAATPPDAAEAAAAFEQTYRQAWRLYENEQFWDAIQMLEPVGARAQGRLGAATRVLLARCYLRNPNWARRAEEMLLSVTRTEPGFVEAWVLLGSIYAEKGMRARACNIYRKVLELRPEHEDASAYLAAHGAEEPPPEAPPGMLRRLFRRS